MRSIPYGHQSIRPGDIREVAEVLGSDWLTQGPKVPEFEAALAGHSGAKYAVAVSSGTAALHIAALAAGLKRGDEAITSPITFVASANCALYCGARPVFADVDPSTANIIPEEISRNVTIKTKAIIPVDFAGLSCDMKEIYAIARRKNIIVIEDAAHALGGEYKSSRAGSCRYSDMAVFSFHPVKSITTGEGGAVLTNNKSIYKALLYFRNHGIVKGAALKNKKMKNCPWYYEMQGLGFNYRMTDIQAALGLSQLKSLDSFIEKRKAIAGLYDRAFAGNEFFDTPAGSKDAGSSCHLYPIRIKDGLEGRRRDIFLKMRRSGLGVQVHYIPVYLQPYYHGLGFRPGLCPNAESFYGREISLPIYPALKPADIKYVIENVFKAFRGLGRS